MRNHEIRDLSIIGAGPAGLFALFYAGMRGASAQIIDALPQPGGQLAALYPEKHIFDVAGFPKVLAKDLVTSLVQQAGQFQQPVHLGQRVVGLEEQDGIFTLITETDRFPSRAIILAAGIGAFSPRKLPQACAEPWYGKGIDAVVLQPSAYVGKHVTIIGGGDSAFDWAHQLQGVAKSITLVHRSDRFRAHQATVDQVMAAAAEGRAAVHTFHELADVIAEDGRIVALELKDIKAKTTRRVDCDVVLPMLGFVSDMGALLEWGLNIEKDEIQVTQLMETGRAGIWACGDVNTYPGKLKLIATGFAESCIAVNQAVHWVYPDKKVNPGHSSNLAVFGQKDD
ncbi:MAG: NAD(P)/FAD-dependent oxidoreductase [Gemmatimonadaceae bacterium]|jgi:thioredoxin reductase|nr:NAD(P)/FAD-dependent oxidoreductase [Gemmatimonadaceae bacterium]